MKIEILDNSIFCVAKDAEGRRKLTKLLRYKYTWYSKDGNKRIRHAGFASFLDSKAGFFLAGFLPRVLRKYPDTQIIGEVKKLAHKVPSLKGIIFREDQLAAISAALEKQKGVIKFATASGKTVIAGGIISSFNQQTVFLAHRKEIVEQTYQRFKEYGFNAGILTGSNKLDLASKVLCATVQSYFKGLDKGGVPHPKVAIVDECHHVQNENSTYAKIIEIINPKVIIGLTGTLPNSKYGKLCLEGFVGRIIARLAIQEGVDKGILSKPKITLLPVPKLGSISKYSRYYDIKDFGMVHNVERNRIIAQAVKERVANKKSCLVIVDRIEHGKKLAIELKKIDCKTRFFQSAHKGEIRESTKEKLIKKEVYSVITTNIWNEGIDIPSLDVVVLADIGKAYTRTIQGIGRGLRRTEDKGEVEIIDFLDPYKYLSEHLVQRLTIYIKEGLM